jgi:hypothetical protein
VSRSAPGLLILALALACAGSAPPGEVYLAWSGPLQACENPRPDDCGFEEPQVVCGRRHATWRDYKNACTACRDEAVSGYRDGVCPGSREPGGRLDVF